MRVDGVVRGLGLDAALWRSLALFRLASWAYAVVSAAVHADGYARPTLAVAVLLAMGGWTVATAWAYRRPSLHRWPLLIVDLAVAVAAQLSSAVVLTQAAIERGDPTITVSWAAAPVIAWAVWRGPAYGAFAAATVAAGAVLERGGVSQATVNSVVLLLLVGVVTGVVTARARQAGQERAEAIEASTAAAERNRLARQVHDGVLQTLALVRRGDNAVLAELAAEQEVALRRLLSGPDTPPPAGTLDLLALLPAAAAVELSGPGLPVLLPAAAARELAAATAAAVDNARRHGGDRTWVLVEDDADGVVVTVRDNGPGIAPDRLAAAAAEGRLGVRSSIVGRLRDLGGSATLTSTPGQGTEVELRVVRSRLR